MLPLIESFQALKGFPIAKYKVLKTEKDASDLEFPIWLKVDLEGHKTEQKAIIRVRDKSSLERALKDLRKKFPTQTIIAQEDIEGIQLILGIKTDKVFGKLLLLGFGGTFTEIAKDISFRSLPIDKKEIESSLKELKLYKALISRKKYAIDKLVKLADKLANLEIKEADLNPVILNEKEAIIIDARVEV